MATQDKDFRIKNGLVVEGTTATVNGSNILTSSIFSTLNTFTTTQTITPGTAVTALAINGATSSTGITIKGAATPGTFIDYRDNANTSVGSVGSDGTHFIKNIRNVGGSVNRAVFSDLVSSIIVNAANTNYIGLSVRRFNDSQTSDLQQWTNSNASTVYAKIDKDGNTTAASFIKTGGTSTQFLKADGSIDSSVFPRSTYSSIPPTSPTPLAGDVWINSETGIQYIYISDGNSAQWVSNDAGPTITSTRSEIATIVRNAQTSAYVLQATDNGKYIDITTGGVVIDTSTSMTMGQNSVIFNNSASSQTITQGSGVTLRYAGSASTGNRSLSQYGVATLLCVATNIYLISGTGLS